MKTNDQMPTQEQALNAPENIRGYKQTSTVNSDEDNNQNHMNTQNGSPVTESLSEQATAYAAASDSELTINNNLETEMNMKEETLKTAEEMVDTTISNNVDSITDMNGNLSDDIIKICKEAEEKIVNMLEPDGLAGTVMEKSLINLTGAYKAGKIKVARLKMNRKPKAKAIKALKESIMKVGQQILLLLIPATVAKAMGFEIESFDGKDIPEDELSITVVVVDGQTRLQAYLEFLDEDPNSSMSDLFAYFPLNLVSLGEMLTSINLKVFCWKNSDFITGILGTGNVEDEKKKALKYIKELESANYNYTSACEWVTFRKGIITKTPLVNAMNFSSSSLDLQQSKYAIEIIQAARNKFTGDNESALKRKAFPEFIITQWNDAGSELIYSERVECFKKFFDGLSDEDVNNIAKPSGYTRKCEKKKEEFIIEQLEKSFKEFLTSHPYSEFKDK